MKKTNFKHVFVFLVMIVEGGQSCKNGPQENTSPRIYCPSVLSNWVVHKGAVKGVISWNAPSVYDNEDSYPSYFQTDGPSSGSVFTEGYYYIRYKVYDSKYASDYCSFSFTLKVRRCSLDHLSISYGSVTCYNAEERNVYGSQCYYSCDTGYRLVGSSMAECQENEYWSQSKPSCTLVVCGSPPSVSYGNFYCNSYSYGITCSLSCSYGYYGSSKITCQANGYWSSAGSCRDVTPPTINCGPDVEVYAGPKRGKVSVVWSAPSASDNSGHVTVNSDLISGSFFDVGEHKVNFYATDNAGQVSRCVKQISVKVKVCPVFEPPQNSTTFCSHENVLGSECTVLCPRGFQLVGDALHVCQDNSLWNGTGAACQLMNCTPPVKVSNGQINCPNGIRFQDVCYLTCQDGFSLNGKESITCTEDLTWTESGFCIDVQPPVFVDGCHGDIHKEAASLGEDTRVVYNFPRVSDNSGQFLVSGHPQSGSRFQVGVTLVTLTAVDVSNNSVTCSFHVNVTYVSCEDPHIDQSVSSLMVYDCPSGHVLGAFCQLTCQDGSDVTGAKSIWCSSLTNGNVTWTWSENTRPYCGAKACKPLPPPDNGALSCDVTNGTSRVCVVMCNENFVRQEAAPSSYMCMSSSQSWSPRSFVPNCLARRRPDDITTTPSFYYFSGDCSSDVNVVREKFITALSSLQLVGTEGKCDVREVKVTCGRQTKRRRSKREFVFVYQITPVIAIEMDREQPDFNQVKTSYSVIVESINEQLANMSTSGNLDLLGVGSVSEFENGRLELRCEPGTRLMADSWACVSCGQGYIYDTKTDKCRECPKDTYQDQDIGFTCKPCPTGTTTVYMGSVSLKQCQGHCPAGHYSDTGMTPCQKCPAGTYQSERGMHVCDLCPFGMSTPQTGTTSAYDCRFAAVRLDENSPGPVMQVQDESPVTFTFMTWLSADVTNNVTRLRLSLEHSTVNTSCAGLVLGHVTICLYTDVTNQTRDWTHVGLVYNNGTLKVYENGHVRSWLHQEFGDLRRKTIRFTSSGDITYLLASGVQMTLTEYTELQMLEFASSCLAEVDNNILAANSTTEFHVSTCYAAVNGAWSKWGPWSACDVTCGQGLRRRTRSCDSPPPDNGGDFCLGEQDETIDCSSVSCDFNLLSENESKGKLFAQEENKTAEINMLSNTSHETTNNKDMYEEIKGNPAHLQENFSDFDEWVQTMTTASKMSETTSSFSHVTVTTVEEEKFDLDHIPALKAREDLEMITTKHLYESAIGEDNNTLFIDHIVDSKLGLENTTFLGETYVSTVGSENTTILGEMYDSKVDLENTTILGDIYDSTVGLENTTILGEMYVSTDGLENTTILGDIYDSTVGLENTTILGDIYVSTVGLENTDTRMLTDKSYIDSTTEGLKEND
ncbi:sushi, von Willebrand factor type A, EGF and pentraxin domain-containing protein 1-like isoform X2 [Physella acuta]|uniref:sushi, von Willebrand factor type A, EGF and pentraxin domain-containing protein 1-like isoform X2 n=1 Tax=Physella acuta TaxID=109671 RepID=UPI0027DCAC49|nr:sushi, von Willebrand factor type A, EGF and pentraxin domain-containing protein 1-like isoform X2 [Physella acuta]